MRRRPVGFLTVVAVCLGGCSGFGTSGGSPPPPPVAAMPVQPAAPSIPTGAALGGVLAGPVGAALSEADREAAWNAQVSALDSGQRRSWRGAHGVFGFVELGAETGGGCRAYSQTIYVAGRPNRGQGVGCKQPDSSWKMAN
jgi:surface antigen